MSDLFLKAVNMSISAGWLIVVVFVFRLILKRAPKWTSMLLWAIVAVRLICPLSLESTLSLIPSTETFSPEIMTAPEPVIHSGFRAIDRRVNPVFSQTFAPNPVQSANPLQIWIPILSVIWMAGIFALLAYTVISYWKLSRRVRTAVRFQDNIYQSELVTFPFVLGILRPRVYLPFKLTEQDRNYVIAHEHAHIRRKDYWWKPFGFLLVTVYWFNPLMWIAYLLFCRDIELACDENVINTMEKSDKAAYAQALLNCSIPRKINLSCPLAFGEVGVKQRVKSVLHYRKPAFWIIFTAVIICIVIAVCFLTNPKSDIVVEEDAIESNTGTDEDSGGSEAFPQPVEDSDIADSLNTDDMDGSEETQQPVSTTAPEVPVPEIDTATLFAQMPDTFYFMSGAGGWFTELYLSDDGTFTGLHFDADMGDAGWQYPYGTEYVCEFSGAFSEPEKVGDYVCSTHVISLEYAPPETVTYEDDVRRITSIPYGLENADEVLIYLPGYPVEELSSDVNYWIQNAEEFWGLDDPSTLPFYVLCNVNEQEAFYSKARSSPEQSAQAAYLAFLSGDGSLLEDAQLGQEWVDFYLPNSELEYVIGDLDGDGISELLIQYVDTPEYLNAVFHYDNGQLICWAFDDVEMSSRDYPLSDGTMVHQYDFNGTSSYTIFRYLSNGEKENLASLFTRYEVIPEDSPLPIPYFEIDGIETDQITFETELAERITNQRLDSSIWTAIP